jgi:hypothetical protein
MGCQLVGCPLVGCPLVGCPPVGSPKLGYPLASGLFPCGLLARLSFLTSHSPVTPFLSCYHLSPATIAIVPRFHLVGITLSCSYIQDLAYFSGDSLSLATTFLWPLPFLWPLHFSSPYISLATTFLQPLHFSSRYILRD